ncbi:TPA_asm: hypothetical protein HUJ06_000202 [Nelumbo nucifera]|uniref:Uncharacterized protein n=1 Tax=Nelumbo nucifera TaxID=4432 RepID=A0A822ZXS7_NELNU|nr:TPA_asm: hypothetical protein HUJ06_031925 [Nelumbo nucifera]DAD49385.1 TPA_asm: hypothetical protein HUJ06_019196 [Nelumbo nucifera]DAD49677.1 TPA_asm: hypothetical protein HUJ06_000202 [Nelumbo nucifera]
MIHTYSSRSLEICPYMYMDKEYLIGKEIN